MSKKLEKINLKNFSKNFSGILTNDMEECMEVLKTNKDAKLLVVVPKTDIVNPTNTKAPAWFQAYEKKQDERWTKQEKFNEKIINRLEKIETRIDNLIKKNNLKE